MAGNGESSIQPSQKLNERTVGTAAGNFQKPRPTTKKDKLKLLLHPSSIPAKFQTIHYDDNEDKGFNSTSCRFSQQPVSIITILYLKAFSYFS